MLRDAQQDSGIVYHDRVVSRHNANLPEAENYSSSSSVYRGGVGTADGGVLITISKNSLPASPYSLYKQRESWITKPEGVVNLKSKINQSKINSLS